MKNKQYLKFIIRFDFCVRINKFYLVESEQKFKEFLSKNPKIELEFKNYVKSLKLRINADKIIENRNKTVKMLSEKSIVDVRKNKNDKNEIVTKKKYKFQGKDKIVNNLDELLQECF